MIKYETNDSQFFLANKKYCEAIQNSLRTINVEGTGFCNSYGYEIDATINKDNLVYKFHFEKHQTVQNGIIIPRDSNEYAGVKLSILGLNKNSRFKLGKSKFRRLFTSTKFRGIFPSPYFLKSSFTSIDMFDNDLLKMISKYSVLEIKLRNGELICKINLQSVDPVELISDTKFLEKL